MAALQKGLLYAGQAVVSRSVFGDQAFKVACLVAARKVDPIQAVQQAVQRLAVVGAISSLLLCQIGKQQVGVVHLALWCRVVVPVGVVAQVVAIICIQCRAKATAKGQVNHFGTSGLQH